MAEHRDHQFNVALTASERRALDDRALDLALSPHDLIRLLINEFCLSRRLKITAEAVP